MPMHEVNAVKVLCIAAAMNAGATQHVAQILTEATLAAELRGRREVGLKHFLDFLQGFSSGSINGSAMPEVTHEGAMVWANADGGIPHTGFIEAGPMVVDIARRQGCAVFMQGNSYTCGELGYFTDYFARQGLLAFATANTPALLAVGGSTGPVLGTNPMSMAAPLDEGPPLLIDQATSNVAYVSIREAALNGKSIPDGWALDSAGSPTTDPSAALAGALLPFGNHKGANLAIMAEVFAGLAGGNWSLDAPSFLGAEQTPGIGMFILVIDPTFRQRGFPRRLRLHLDRLQGKHRVPIPGRRGKPTESTDDRQISVPEGLMARLRETTHRPTHIA